MKRAKKDKRKKPKKEKPVKPVKLGKLFKRPLVDAEELERLSRTVEERCERFLERVRIPIVIAVLVLIANLGTTAFDSDSPREDRVFSVIVIFFLSIPIAPVAMRRLVTHPRLVEAQRRLLQQRGLVADDRVETLGEELEKLLRRIRKSWAAAGGDPADLERVRGRAVRFAEELRYEDETISRESRPTEPVELEARLEAFRVALVNLHLEALLKSDFFTGKEAGEALARAVAILDGEAAPTPSARAPATDTLRPTLLPESTSPEADAGASSIAVLPFTDLSVERDQEFFCHGVAEELINALTRIHGLRVIARASAFAFETGKHDAREIGRALDVETLVEGSVRKAGERLRVTVQMVRTCDGNILWSERYDRDSTDVFAVQDEITATLVEHLHVELLGQQPAERHKDVSLEAYELYLRGRHLWNRRNPPELRSSTGLFQQAVAAAPGYALAHAGLADAYNLLGFYSLMPPHEAFPKAITAATQALELDAGLAEAHASLAFAALLYQWDWRCAEDQFRRALELNPGYTTAHHWYSEYLGLMGRHDEALAQARIAHDLDPLSPVIHTLLGWNHYYQRHYDDAATALRRPLELAQGFAPAAFWLGLTRLEQGRFEDAERALADAVEHSDRSTMMLAAQGRLLALRERSDEAREILTELIAQAREHYVPPYYCAAVRSALGDVEEAFECLEQAFEERDNWMVFLKVDPLWDDLRSDPRFLDLLQRVGFV